MHFQRGELGVVKGPDKLVLQVGVDDSSLIVHPFMLLVLAEYALLFPGSIQFWDSSQHSRVGRADKGGAGDTSIFLGRKDEPKVAVMESAKVALD